MVFSQFCRTIIQTSFDRANFNEMWQKIVLKLEQGKKYIVELIDQSTVSILTYLTN